MTWKRMELPPIPAEDLLCETCLEPRTVLQEIFNLRLERQIKQQLHSMGISWWAILFAKIRIVEVHCKICHARTILQLIKL